MCILIYFLDDISTDMNLDLNIIVPSYLGRIWWKFDFLKIHFSSDFSLEGHILRYILH